MTFKDLFKQRADHWKTEYNHLLVQDRPKAAAEAYRNYKRYVTLVQR